MHADAVLKAALVLFCDFINSFVPADETESHYLPIDFTDDPDNGHYGYTKLLHTIEGPYGDIDPLLYIYEVSIGDEGGPSILYVWANDETIVHMSYLFDTMMSNICTTDGMTNELIMLHTRETDDRFTK